MNRGLYRKADAAGEDNLIEIAAQRPRATLCLQTALAAAVGWVIGRGKRFSVIPQTAAGWTALGLFALG